MEFKKHYKFQIQQEEWRVKEFFKIKWDNAKTSFDYTIKSPSGATKYLEVLQQTDGQLFFGLYKKESNRHFLSPPPSQDLIRLKKFSFPKAITHHQISYAFKERERGNSYSSHFESETVESLIYESEEETQFLSIEVWNSKELEIYTGTQLQAEEVIALNPSWWDMMRFYLGI